MRSPTVFIFNYNCLMDKRFFKTTLMVTLHFYWFCVTVLHFFQYKAGQISLISLDFIVISPFLIRFEPLREPLMRFPTVFIL